MLSSSARIKGAAAMLVAGGLLVAAQGLHAQGLPAGPEYRSVLGLDSRLAVWTAAQLHLMFAAFVLAVPMFAVLIEYFGWRASKSEPDEAQRYDWLAHEMARLLPAAYSLTAITGALLGFLLFTAYPKFMGYLSGVFGPTFVVYPLFFVAETLCLYFWYYAWDRLQGERKWLHLLLGLLLNLFGTIVMFIADACGRRS